MIRWREALGSKIHVSRIEVDVKYIVVHVPRIEIDVEYIVVHLSRIEIDVEYIVAHVSRIEIDAKCWSGSLGWMKTSVAWIGWGRGLFWLLALSDWSHDCFRWRMAAGLFLQILLVSSMQAASKLLLSGK
jgi:hypothetical protein